MSSGWIAKTASARYKPLRNVRRFLRSRPGCDHHLFWQCDCYTTHFYVFWEADSESDIERLELKKMTARTIWNFEITMGGPKNPNLRILTKKGYKGCMWRFQIWSQNLDRTTFRPLLGQKTVENWQYPVFDHFWATFWPKMGWNVVRFKLETAFGILSSFAAYMTHFCLKTQISIFWFAIVI